MHSTSSMKNINSARKELFGSSLSFPFYWTFATSSTVISKTPLDVDVLVSVPEVVVDVLVFVHSLRGWWASFGDTKQESQDGSKEFANQGRRGLMSTGNCAGVVHDSCVANNSARVYVHHNYMKCCSVTVKLLPGPSLDLTRRNLRWSLTS